MYALGSANSHWEERPRLIGMSDRILIMHEGRISGEAMSAEADEEMLLAYCYGKTA